MACPISNSLHEMVAVIATHVLAPIYSCQSSNHLKVVNNILRVYRKEAQMCGEIMCVTRNNCKTSTTQYEGQ